MAGNNRTAMQMKGSLALCYESNVSLHRNNGLKISVKFFDL